MACDSFSKETISDDDYIQKYNDVGKLNETDRLVLIDIRTRVMIKVTE